MLFETANDERGNLESKLGWGWGSRRLKSGSRGRRLKSEPEFGSGSGSRGRWLKSEPEQEQKSKPELKQKPDDDEDLVEKMDFSKYENSSVPYMYERGDFVYMNEAYKKMDAVVQDYINRMKDLGPYDSIDPPAIVNNVLGGGVRPYPINDDNRDTLIASCKLALKDYNQRSIQAPTYVFHQLVKCCFAFTSICEYYITFQAKAEGEDPSNTPAITTFQALVFEGDDEIGECEIKI